MAKKILFVIAGPRLTGNSAEAARIVADAARSAGNEVNIVELPNLAKGGNVGCISCYGCQRSEEYKCVIHDDMGKLVASLVQYDIVAIASPVFFFSIPSQAKAFIDRFFSLTKHIDGKLQSPLSKIRLVFIASSG
ncbi:MAG: flavodoxin family protein, partial [Victivallales bacterium]|nr:flavodoxin family protein [Victivallales bacterium]